MSASPSVNPWYETREFCRVCHARLDVPYLDLGIQPLANGGDYRAPLAVARCPDCGLSQLTVVVDPSVLYERNYPFRSGTTAAWREHAKALADQFGESGFVIDVAANDGTQLAPFQSKGWTAVGVDPAGLDTVQDGVTMVQNFWSESVARSLVHDFSTADLIIGQNVLGHVDDPSAFFRACEVALAPEGRVVIEVPHVGDLLERGAFDTIYHEHLSYWSLPALERSAQFAGLVVVDVEHLDVHGGSRRYWLARWPHPVGSSVIAERERDAYLAGADPYRAFAVRVHERLDGVRAVLDSVAGKRMWGYGASAKGAVMLNALLAAGNEVWPTRIVDDTVAKAGTRVPGVNIKVVCPPVNMALVDVMWILSWNWSDTLVRRAREQGFRGQFLVTHPAPRLVAA